MSTFRVPAVDIAPYVGDGTPEQRAAVAHDVDAACREVGFIQIHGHGIPAEVVAGLGEAMDAFFALDPDRKLACRRPNSEKRGYTPPTDSVETYEVGRAASEFPGLELRPEHFAENTWPDVDGFQPRVAAYFAEAGRVARTMTRIFGDALGLPPSFFVGLTAPSIDVLRMNHYSLPQDADRTLDGDLGMGEHTDFGIVTILWADRVRGLEVLGSDGRWHAVDPEPGALLVNPGDLTARLTNERWRSTLHRVRPPVVGGRVQRRRSAAYFHDGNPEAVVAPLACCVDAGHPALYDPVTVDEHIRAKLAGSRAGRRDDPVTRETVRVLQ